MKSMQSAASLTTKSTNQIDGRPDYLEEASQREGQMMKFVATVSAALVLSASLAALSGCQKQEGPAEHAGKQVDKATEKAGQQVEKAGESIQDAAKGDKK